MIYFDFMCIVLYLHLCLYESVRSSGKSGTNICELRVGAGNWTQAL